MSLPIFGTSSPDITYVDRLAAYAIIFDEAGRVAAVRGRLGCWLPGGGVEGSETPEETVVREVREEIGATFRIVERAGEAIQYFYASTDDLHYRMHAVFFLGELLDEPSSVEHELCWLEVTDGEKLMYHECHDWAVSGIGGRGSGIGGGD